MNYKVTNSSTEQTITFGTVQVNNVQYSVTLALTEDISDILQAHENDKVTEENWESFLRDISIKFKTRFKRLLDNSAVQV